VSDGSLTRGPIRHRLGLFRRPALLIGFVVVGLVLGLAESFATYSESVSQYLGRIVWIGIVWGLYWIAFTSLCGGALIGLLVWLERRRLRRQFPAGSTTEVTVGEEGMVLVGPSGARRVGYEQMTVVKTMGSWVVVCLRRPRMRSLLIPNGALPDTVVERLRARALFPPPLPSMESRGGDVRELVVPPGWAAHLARVHTARAIMRRTPLLRLGLTSLVILVLALVLYPAWMIAVPILWLLVGFGVYWPTRHRLGQALPDGSVSTIEFLDDRLISRNASGAREVRYADVGEVDVHGDVASVRLVTGQTFLMARALLPDEVLQRWGVVA
jgi:hypothetical protein